MEATGGTAVGTVYPPDLEQALSIAVNFTADTIAVTVPDLHLYPEGQGPWYGVQFESCIGKLTEYCKSL